MTISIAQNAGNGVLEPSGTTSISLPFSSDNTANNGLIYIVNMSDNATVTSISDSAGNTIGSPIIEYDNTVGAFPAIIYMYFIPKCIGGANTLTVDFSANPSIFWLCNIIEITDSAGNENGFVLDQIGTANGNSAEGSVSTNGTTTVADEIVIALIQWQNTGSTTTPGAGYTTIFSAVPDNISALSQYAVVASEGIQTATATSSGTIWEAAIATFYTASSPPASTIVQRTTLSPIGTRAGSRQVRNRWQRSKRGGLLMREPLILPRAA